MRRDGRLGSGKQHQGRAGWQWQLLLSHGHGWRPGTLSGWKPSVISAASERQRDGCRDDVDHRAADLQLRGAGRGDFTGGSSGWILAPRPQQCAWPAGVHTFPATKRGPS